MRISDWSSDVCSSDLRGLRSGSLPTPLCVGLGAAAALAAAEMESEAQRISALKNRLLEGIRGRLSGVALNGHATQRIAGNLNLAFEGVDAEALMRALPRLAVSSRSEEHTSELQSLMRISYAVFC